MNIFEAFSSVAKEMRHRRSCWVCYVKISVMAMGGGQTSSQSPDGGGHCGASVEFP